MARPNSIQARIDERLAASSDDVFLTREFNDLGDKRQVLRALSKTVAGGKLIRLGYGVYGRAERSSLSGQPMLAAPQGFVGASRQALDKLGICWEAGQWEQAYNAGQTTQVPVNAVVRIKGRFNRRLAYGGRPLVVER